MNLRNLAIWGVIVAVMIGVYSVVNQGGRAGGASSEISYSQLLRRIDGGEIKTAISACFTAASKPSPDSRA